MLPGLISTWHESGSAYSDIPKKKKMTRLNGGMIDLEFALLGTISLFGIEEDG